MKLGRRCKLTYLKENLQDPTKREAIEIKTPLTVEFDIVRNTASTLNSATFKIYNLSETNRSQIFQEKFAIKSIINRKKIIFNAGYGTDDNNDNNLSLAFIGDILEAYSYRKGSDVITYINALDGGFAAYNSVISQSITKNTTYKNILDLLINSLKGIKKGIIGETLGEPKTPSPLNGNVFSLLNNNYKNEVFIDLEKINKLKINEYIKSLNGKVLLINSETGLLGTPQRQGAVLVVEILFEPQIIVGQLVEIKSLYNPKYNGQYKVIGIKHNGVISGAVGGTCKTTLQLYIGDQLQKGLIGVS